MKNLEGTVALVTGAAQGIGAEYARALARAGAAVSICDILSPDATVEEISECGGNAIGSIVDITANDQVEELASKTISQLGGIDILINNAAIFASLKRTPFLEISSDEWDKVLAVNVRGSFECTKAVVPNMKKRGYGKIVNISSTTVFAGQPLLLHYVTSKGAVIAMTRSLARELGPYGIRVNCLAPGFTLSEGVKANDQYSAQVTDAIKSTRSIVRDLLPEDLVGTLLFLCSRESDFMTGQTIAVDGGTTMR